MVVRRVGHDTLDFSGYIVDVTWFTGPLWTLLLIHAYLSA